jgi:hypothetical protein
MDSALFFRLERPIDKAARPDIILYKCIFCSRQGRHTVLRLGLRERWRHHFATLLNASPRSPFQLWRSSLTTQKTLRSGPGNCVGQAGYGISLWCLTEFFGINSIRIFQAQFFWYV